MNTPTLPDKLAHASRTIGRILAELERETGARVSGLALEELERTAPPKSVSRESDVLLSVRIELHKPPARHWEIG